MMRFFKQELRWHSLKYRKLLNEKGYQIERETYQRWTSKLFFSVFNIITFVFWIARVGNPNPLTPVSVALNISRLALPFILIIFVKYFPKFVEESIIVLISSSIVFHVEIKMNYFISMGIMDIFVYGILIQTLCICLILLRISFNRLTILLFLIKIYICLRILKDENSYSDSTQTFLLCLGNFIFLSSFAYGQEIYLRKIHLERESHEKSLNLYERLIKEILPLSIIIYDDKEIYFTNKETNRIMKIKDGEEFKEKLEEINVEEIRNLDSDSFDRFYNTSKSDSAIIGNFYALMKKIVPRNEFFSCKISNSTKKESDGDNSIIIKFKISRIYWNEKRVKIILICEDHSAKELCYLQQREVFKDKFLATISHELRTPLNGTIGMISDAKSNCKENNISKRLFF
jgi:K+-sensing histidine kinase KdpD